jgi:small subunit ribosomal protein S9
MTVKKQPNHPTSKSKKPASRKKKPAPDAEIKEKQTPPQTQQPKVKQKKSSFFAVGRRKSAIARVYYFINETQEITINGKPFDTYFPTLELRYTVLQPFTETGMSKGKWIAKVTGGGINGQAEAVRLGIARLISQLEPEAKPSLKHAKLLTRDPRVKERKKYGLKRARRAPQWQKR